MQEKPDLLPHDQRRARRPITALRLRKSGDDRLISGILGGIAAFTGLPSLAVRLAYIASVLVSAGVMLLAYPLLWLLLPGPNAATSETPL